MGGFCLNRISTPKWMVNKKCLLKMNIQRGSLSFNFVYGHFYMGGYFPYIRISTSAPLKL